MDDTKGVSEVVGAIFLVVIVAAGIGIVFLLIPLSSPGCNTPAVLFSALVVEADDVLEITHEGGDILEKAHISIRVDGVDRTADFLDDDGLDSWTAWENGQSLYLPLSGEPAPSSVQVICWAGGAGGSGELVWQQGDIVVRPDPGVAPSADFSADVESGSAPLLVQFMDLSSGIPTGWAWDFGDGGTSNLKNPVHNYTTPGTYTVTLTSYNAAGMDTETKVSYIVVIGSIAADFEADSTAGYSPHTVQFSDLSNGSPTGWAWDFGDGTYSGVQSPLHTYANPGNYTVTLTAENVYGNDTETKTGYILVISPCTGSGFQGLYYPSRQFTGTPVERVDTRLWFADPTGVSSGYATDEANWPDDTLGKTNNFGVDYQGYLQVPADGDYTFYLTSDDGSRLWIDSTDLSDTPVINYYWDHSPGTMTATKTLTAGEHPIRVRMYERNGAAVLHLEWSSDAFSRQPVDAVCYIPPTPPLLVAEFSASPRAGLFPLTVDFSDESQGAPVSWLWDFGDGSAPSSVASPQHTYANPGNYTVTLTVTNITGAVDYEVKTGYISVTAAPPNSGLFGYYYTNQDFTGTPAYTGYDTEIRYADRQASNTYPFATSLENNWPRSRIGQTDDFSVDYTGYLLVPADATYTFYLTSDDGSNLWIDDIEPTDTPVVFNWGDHSPRLITDSKYLAAGYHPVRIRMYENTGHAMLHVEWSSPSFVREFITDWHSF